MTEAEIMKALECWASEKECEETCECFKYDTPRCDLLTARNALDLINSKNAEIERLNTELEDKQFRCDSCDRIGLTRSEHIVCIKQAKAEAIKECLEKAKEVTYHYYDSDIDQIAKEMGVEL